MSLVLVIFLQSSDGNIQSQLLLNNFFSNIDLALSTVNDNQIWWRQTVTNDPTIAALDDLSHTGVVVRPYHSLDLVLAVILLARLTIDKDHHS